MGDFATNLKRLRKKRHLTQEEVAEGIGTMKSLISMYETRKRNPSYEMLEALADFFNVDMASLTADERGDADMWEIREALRNRPEMRTLFSISKDATAEEIRAAIRIIGALKEKE